MCSSWESSRAEKRSSPLGDEMTGSSLAELVRALQDEIGPVREPALRVGDHARGAVCSSSSRSSSRSGSQRKSCVDHAAGSSSIGWKTLTVRLRRLRPRDCVGAIEPFEIERTNAVEPGPKQRQRLPGRAGRAATRARAGSPSAAASCETWRIGVVISPTTSDGTIGRPASSQSASASAPDVERLELDPLLAKELPGRRARRSGRLPEQRHALHSAIIAPVKIAVVGAGAMGSVYAGSSATRATRCGRSTSGRSTSRRSAARPERGGRERRPHRADPGHADPAEAGVAELVVLRPRRWTSRLRPRRRGPWSGRPRWCCRCRTGSAAQTPRRACSARNGWRSASRAGSAPRSSRPDTPITTAGARPAGRASRAVTRGSGGRRGVAGRGVPRAGRRRRPAARLGEARLQRRFSGTCTILQRTIGEVLDDPAAW